MPRSPLSPETQRRLDVLFCEQDRGLAIQWLEEECGNNLPFLEKLKPQELDRFRFAALKLSGGRLKRLRSAIELAKVDWRDLLVAADFAHDPQEHERWFPEPPHRRSE